MIGYARWRRAPQRISVYIKRKRSVDPEGVYTSGSVFNRPVYSANWKRQKLNEMPLCLKQLMGKGKL